LSHERRAAFLIVIAVVLWLTDFVHRVAARYLPMRSVLTLTRQ
jgi:hypothetical protein